MLTKNNALKIYTLLTLLACSSLSCSGNLPEKSLLDVSSIIERPIAGKEVILEGNIIGKIENCYVFSDGTSKILVHFHDENITYAPNTKVKISGKIQKGIMPGMHHFKGENHGDISMDTMIMVNKLEIITSSK